MLNLIMLTSSTVAIATVALLALISSQAAAGSQNGDPTHWSPTYYKVFRLKGSKLEPNTTLKLLRRLDRQLKLVEPDQSCAYRSVMVSELLEVSRVTAEKCHRTAFLELDKLIKRYAPYDLSIVPYVSHYEQLLLAECDAIFQEGLAGAVSRLDQMDVDDMEHLMSFKAHVSHDSDGGMMQKFLVDKLRAGAWPGFTIEQLCQSNSKKDYDRHFRLQVSLPCSRVVHEVDPYIFLLEHGEQLSPMAAEWTGKARVCRHIVLHPSLYVDVTYDDLRAKLCSPRLPLLGALDPTKCLRPAVDKRRAPELL